MVKYVSDRTGRFLQRPHYKPEELDQECEGIINSFLKDRNGELRFPISTGDLTRLIERDTESLDLYADLSPYGSGVEGLTIFRTGHKPLVKISAALAGDGRRENRLRTTLTHEYGHVHFHAYLWELGQAPPDLLGCASNADTQICKRESILDSTQADWMEWQAGYACGALLMPISQIQKIVKDHQKTEELCGAINVDDPQGRALIHSVQTTFQVSEDAARIRLLKLGSLTEVTTGQALSSV
ncbi:MAG: ImmA/IrrE family metallo-endopeptidase [Gammaproteobacteria bacterium]|nr:ImmA/IrrE family metallo-endopeptidase [Gammaproteobacteria bacterium]